MDRKLCYSMFFVSRRYRLVDFQALAMVSFNAIVTYKNSLNWEDVKYCGSFFYKAIVGSGLRGVCISMDSI